MLLVLRVVFTDRTTGVDINSPMVESGFDRKVVAVHYPYEVFCFIWNFQIPNSTKGN